MIARIWHGFTTKDNAAVYEDLLKTEIFKSIEDKNVKGYKGMQLLRRELETETEFTTMMWFDNMESIKQFAGEDYETAHVMPKVQAILLRYDKKSIHCELRESKHY